jgi:2-iminoacetate synthase ThiH
MEDRGRQLFSIAQERWLSPEEIMEILQNVDIRNCCREWTQTPQNGQIYLFDRAQFPNFKDDGIEWLKKNATNAVQEQYLKLLINGVHAITGQYATCAQDNVSVALCSPDIHLILLVFRISAGGVIV